MSKIKTWLVRGDTHGYYGWMVPTITENYKPEETAIIILGDAGFNFYLNKTDIRLKKEVESRGYYFYCVRGNHEARPQDTSCPYEKIWDENVNGYVWAEPDYPHIRFFLDYGEYQINNYKIAVIGGAYSVDKWWRLHRFNIYSPTDIGYNNPKKTGWFPNEQLSVEEMDTAMKLFINKTYDFVFTHTCPIDWQPRDLFLSAVDQSVVDNTMELWLNELKNKINWTVWCWGHYHSDRIEYPYAEMYYQDIDNINDIWYRWKHYSQTGELDWWLHKGPNFWANSSK